MEFLLYFGVFRIYLEDSMTIPTYLESGLASIGVHIILGIVDVWGRCNIFWVRGG